MRSSEVTKYLAWAKESTVQEAGVDEVADLERAINFVGVEEVDYVGQDLEDVLWCSELTAAGVDGPDSPPVEDRTSDRACKRAGRRLSA